MASLGGVLVRTGSTFACLAAALAFAICSRNALEELPTFGGDSVGVTPTSDLRVALDFAICSRRAADELDTFRLVSGVFFTGPFRFCIGVAGAASVPVGDIACPKVPPNEGRGFGVRATMVLLPDRGRGFGVFRTFCVWKDGCFLIVELGRDVETVLLGVVAGVATFALTLLLPGAVMDSLPEDAPNLLGVTGDARIAPSLVVGLLLFDIADAGRSGGGMLFSALKKLDLLLGFPGAGDDGSWDRLSMVRSESDGRDFFALVFSGSGSSTST